MTFREKFRASSFAFQIDQSKIFPSLINTVHVGEILTNSTILSNSTILYPKYALARSVGKGSLLEYSLGRLVFSGIVFIIYVLLCLALPHIPFKQLNVEISS